MWMSSELNALCASANEESGPLVNNTLSQVMSPTSSTISTSQRPLQSSSRGNPATPSPRTCMTRRSVTTPSAERSLHHCSLKSKKNQRAVDKACHSREESLLSRQSLSVGHVRTVRAVHELSSLGSSSREKPSRDSENEQIRVEQRFRNTSSKPIMTEVSKN